MIEYTRIPERRPQRAALTQPSKKLGNRLPSSCTAKSKIRDLVESPGFQSGGLSANAPVVLGLELLIGKIPGYSRSICDKKFGFTASASSLPKRTRELAARTSFRFPARRPRMRAWTVLCSPGLGILFP
jgi:hypothetical protein